MPADAIDLETLLDGMDAGLCIVDRAGRVVAANRRLAELLALPSEQLRAGDPAGKLPELLRQSGTRGADAAYVAFERRLADAPRQSFAFDILRSDGRSLRFCGNPSAAGGFAVTVTDATELHRARAVEDMLRQALDSIADGFAVFDSSDRLVMMNKLYIGYPSTEADGPQLGIMFEDLMRQDRKHGFYPEVVGHEDAFIKDRVAAHREGAGRPVNFKTSDGRWAQARDYRMPDGSTVVVRTDVSELVERDRSLRESQALLEAMSEASPDGILVTDAQGRYLFWNRRFKEIWNLPDEYLESRRSAIGPARANLRPYTDQMVEPRLLHDEIARAYDPGEPPKTAFVDIALKDGRVIDRRTARVDAGKLPYAIVAWNFRDVTEQRKRDAALAETERLTTVGELSGGMAHELNNLLMVIGGNLELIEAQQRGSKGELAKKYAAMAQSAVERGSELIRNLLTFSRRQPLAPRLIDVNQFVADTLTMMTRLVGGSVTLNFLPGAKLWHTVVDPGFLQTTLVSLATNARDAMPRGGSIVIETSNQAVDEAHAKRVAELAPGEYVLMTVTDNGTGMPPEVAKRAFEPFFTTKPVGKGTGLGLSVVYGFVKQSGGHVTIESGEGHGTSVSIYLPRAASGATAGPEALVEPVARGNKERILLVEDEEPVMAVARAFLSDLGYDVLEAGNGREALAILRTGEPVDLLFTDVVLPDGMNGAELAHAAQQLRPGLKVLFASGHGQKALAQQDGLGPDVKLLQKPYRKRDLALALSGLL